MKKLKPTVKVVRPKKTRTTKDKTATTTRRKKKMFFKDDVVKAVLKMLDDTEKEIDDEGNKDGNDGDED